jgi:hypothetical protein
LRPVPNFAGLSESFGVNDHSELDLEVKYWLADFIQAVLLQFGFFDLYQATYHHFLRLHFPGYHLG